MGFEEVRSSRVEGWAGIRSLIRRKQVDSDRPRAAGGGHHQLAKHLSVPQLVAIGIDHQSYLFSFIVIVFDLVVLILGVLFGCGISTSFH